MLLEQFEQEQRKLTVLMEIAKLANQKNPLQKNLQNIIDMALELMEEKKVVIRTYDEQTQQLILQAYHGMPKGYDEKFKTLSPCSHIFELLRNGQPFIVQDVSLMEPVGLSGFLVRNGLLSTLCIPLMAKEEIVGIIAIYSDQASYYKKNEESIYSILANQIAMTIENAHLYKNLKDSYLKTTRALVIAVEAKDPYTRGHAERVAKYSIAIGQELKLDKDFLKNLEIAASLHDIGKIGVPESILVKPAKLNIEEFTIMKNHPIHGQSILDPIKLDSEILDGVYYHHERLDGQGYPFGLKEKQIPLTARILAVADAFDAMTSDRPYRQRLSSDQALKELIKCSNTQFDPEIVEAFLRFHKKSY